MNETRQHRSVPRRRLGLVASAGAAAALLLGAGGAVASVSHASRHASKSAAPPAQLTIAESTDPVSMNPLQQRVTSTYSVLRNLYDPLVDFASATNFKTFSPVLATSWKQVSPTEMRFQLRKGVTFQDGQSFDAQSVVYTVQALLGQLPGSQPALAAFLFPTLTKAVAAGPYTVDLYTKVPDPQLLPSLTQLLIIPTGSASASSDLARVADGTGPYKFVSWVPDQQVTMTAKPNYFLGVAPIKTIVWETIPSSTSELAALLAGKVNLVFGLDPSQVKSVRRSAISKVATVPSTRTAALWLNTLSDPYLKSAKVRQALNYAVDRQALVSSTLEGLGEPLATMVPSYFTGYNASLKPYPYDPAKAVQLLKEAGYPHGFPLTIMVPSTHYVLGTQIVQVIASELNAVGIKATIDQVSFSSFATLTAKRKIPGAFYGAWGSTYPDPEQMFQVIVLGGTKGFSWYNDPAVNRLINAAAVARSKPAYVSDLEKVQSIMYQNPPFVYLFAYKDAWGMSKNLAWTPSPTEVEYMYSAHWKH